MAKNSNYIINNIVKVMAEDRELGYPDGRVMEATVILSKIDKNLRMMDLPKIVKSEEAYRLLQPMYDSIINDTEMFTMLVLSRAHHVMARSIISTGGVSGTVVDPKIIFRRALMLGASSIVVAHNHPSGQTKPSEQDLSLTRKLREAGRNLEITLLDHIILGDNSYYSFADEGQL